MGLTRAIASVDSPTPFSRKKPEIEMNQVHSFAKPSTMCIPSTSSNTLKLVTKAAYLSIAGLAPLRFMISLETQMITEDVPFFRSKDRLMCAVKPVVSIFNVMIGALPHAFNK